ncbi:MAG: rhodanese-like domain-containing protein [Gemmatimonadota bacterium]
MSTGPQDIPEITPTELKERLDAGDRPVLLDVRESNEWEIGNLSEHGAVLRPMSDIYDWKSEFDPGDDIVVYCRTGGRSGWIVRDLVDAGFEHVRNLQGGINAWSADVDPSIPRY